MAKIEKRREKSMQYFVFVVVLQYLILQVFLLFLFFFHMMVFEIFIAIIMHVLKSSISNTKKTILLALFIFV